MMTTACDVTSGLGLTLKIMCFWISFIFIDQLLRFLFFRKMCTVLLLSFS